MNLKDVEKQFNNRWKIQKTLDYEQEFKKFKIGALNGMENVDLHLKQEGISEFCIYYGIKKVWHRRDPYSEGWSSNVISKLEQEDDELEFYKLLQIIFSLPFKTENDRYKHLIPVIQAAEYSEVNLNVTFAKNENAVLFLPKGEKVLDKEIVDEALSFLEGSSGEHYIDALSFHGKNTKPGYIKSAEETRRTVEEYLRQKLSNKNDLKSNIVELGKKMKSEKVAPELRNIIIQIFHYLENYALMH